MFDKLMVSKAVRLWLGRIFLASIMAGGMNSLTHAKDVEAGPIWNQADAEKKCPPVAAKAGGKWNGQWRTTVPGQMSVCGVEIETRNVNAGPIWNQADAEKKCPALAKMEKGRWNGEWRTVTPNVSSVCGIEYPLENKPTYNSKAEEQAARDKALREHAANISAQRQAERERAQRERAAQEQVERDKAMNEAQNSEEAAALVAAMAGLFGQGEQQAAQNDNVQSNAGQSSTSASGGYKKAYSNGDNSEETKCHDMVQDTVAWNWSGNTRWNKNNIDGLCSGTKSAKATVVCFEGVMAIHDDWSRATKACAQ